MKEKKNEKEGPIIQNFITKKELTENSDTLINTPVGSRRLWGKFNTVTEDENSYGNSNQKISNEDFDSLKNELPSKENIVGKSFVRIMLEEDGRFSDEEINLIESSH